MNIFELVHLKVMSLRNKKEKKNKAEDLRDASGASDYIHMETDFVLNVYCKD